MVLPRYSTSVIILDEERREIVSISSRTGFVEKEGLTIRCPFECESWLKDGNSVPSEVIQTPKQIIFPYELTESDSGEYEYMGEVKVQLKEYFPLVITYDWRAHRHITEVFVGGKYNVVVIFYCCLNAKVTMLMPVQF